MTLQVLQESLSVALKKHLVETLIDREELTLVVAPKSLLESARILKEDFHFEQLIDIAGIDYSTFGEAEWDTQEATARGFSRGVRPSASHPGSRFAVSYHLLSYFKNQRLRLKCFLDDHWPEVPSVTDIWPAANWFEREAFDLFGIIFKNHPDLRRILTDYGFIGHPFRKDFPLIGTVEMRYDATQNRVLYDEVEIVPRTLVPRVIRKDNRYEH